MTEQKSRRGFATMDRAAHAEIARKGGIAAQAKSNVHRFNTEDASAAGKIGGIKVSQDRAHMARIGRLGGEARQRKKAEAKALAAEAEQA